MIQPPCRLIIEMLIFFTACFLPVVMFQPVEDFVIKYFAQNTDYVPYEFHIWQLVTSIFFHAGIGHFIGNMLYLYVFGNGLASTWTRREFISFFLICGIGSSLVVYICNVMFETDAAPSLGASGAIFGLMAAFLINYGEQTVHFIFLLMIPMKAKYLVYVLFAIELILLWRGTQNGVGHLAHVSGAVIGYVYLKWVRKQQRKLAGQTSGKADAGSRLGGLEVMDDLD
ncbi:MAG: rhomboid family intramembrane serine protease [Planctomycetes bacterium]|nr:rhomboid family intramembrane serine protease [Planctomycetota bacterium]